MIAFCAECGAYVEAIVVDHGGPCQIWGRRETYQDLALQCAKCDSEEIFDENPDTDENARRLTVYDYEN